MKPQLLTQHVVFLVVLAALVWQKDTNVPTDHPAMSLETAKSVISVQLF